MKKLFPLLLLLIAINLQSQITSDGVRFYFSFLQNRILSSGEPTNGRLITMSNFVYISNTTDDIANVKMDYSGDNIAYIFDNITHYTGSNDNIVNFDVQPGESKRIKIIPMDSITYYNPYHGYSITWPDHRVVQMMNNGEKQNKVFYIESTNFVPLNVFSESAQNNSRDEALVLPLESLGNYYYCFTYNPKPLNDGTQCYSSNGNYGGPAEIVIVGVEDNTTINLKLPPSISSTQKAWSNVDSNNCNLFTGDTIHTIVLNKNEAIQIQSDDFDLSGSYISGNKRFAVFSGNMCTNIEANAALDHLYESMIPIKNWGKDYITTPLNNGVDDVIRIISATDNTNIYRNGNLIANLNCGEFIELLTNNNADFYSTDSFKLINIAQYSVSAYYNSSTADQFDPMMMIISPTNYTVMDITFSVPPETAQNATNCNSHIKDDYLSIVVLNHATDNVFIEDDSNNPVLVSNYPALLVPWTAVQGTNDYSYCIVDISNNSTTDVTTYRLFVDSIQSNGFNAYVYGFDCKDGYGYAAGINLPIYTKTIYTEENTGDIYFYQNKLFIVSNINEVMQLEIINMNGKIVYSNNIIGKKEINCNHLPQGMYCLRVKNKNKKIIKKFVVY